jgi:hypothetical protein
MGDAGGLMRDVSLHFSFCVPQYDNRVTKVFGGLTASM